MSSDDSSMEEESECDSVDDIVECAVSIDGSWLTTGFSSRHGFVSMISIDTGKVLDRIYMCSTCTGCAKWSDNDKHTTEYLAWYAKHEEKCPLNHEGSAQSMEAEGAVRLFQRSEDVNGLRYNPYVGDGDSKSYLRVVKAQPYGPTFVIEKEECIGHIQKRMGTRLRKLLPKFKGKISLVKNNI
jgi:hypothetical protein